MRSSIYKNYEKTEEPSTKSKIRLITLKIVRNAINQIEALAKLNHHVSKANTNTGRSTHRLSTNRVSQEAVLDTLNSKIEKSAQDTHTGFKAALSAVSTETQIHHPKLANSANELILNFSKEWEESTVNPEEIRDKLTDMLRILDPESVTIPRVVSQRTFELRKSGNQPLAGFEDPAKGGNNALASINTNAGGSLGAAGSRFAGLSNPTQSTSAQSINRVNVTVAKEASEGISRGSQMKINPRVSMGGLGHPQPIQGHLHQQKHIRGVGAQFQPDALNAASQVAKFSPIKPTSIIRSPMKNGFVPKISKPKYYRIDENGNRIQIEGPPQPTRSISGTPTRVKSLRNDELMAISPTKTENSVIQSKNSPFAFRGHPGHFVSPNKSQQSRMTGSMHVSGVGVHPASGRVINSPHIHGTPTHSRPGRGVYNVAPLTPSRMISPNTPPPSYPKSANSPFRILPSGVMTPNRGLNQVSLNQFVAQSVRGGQNSVAGINFEHKGILGTQGSLESRTNAPGGGVNGVETLNVNLEQQFTSEAVKTMITDAKQDFSNPVVEYFDCDNYPVKIESSYDSNYLYYAGDSLGIVKRKNKWLVNQGLVKNQKMCTLKSLRNGDLICNEFESWDLILLDRNLNEKQRLMGAGNGAPDYYRLIKTRVSDDEEHLLWLRSQSEISIVNIANFSARHIHNFWNFKGTHARATAVGLDSTGTKLAGIGFIESPHEIQTIHVFDGGDGVSIFEADEIHPEVSAWICLEVSIDSDVFFLGGAQKRDFVHGDAFIFALYFDENAETLTFHRFGPESGFHCINSLRRHPEGNVLFAGCHDYLGVILWAENRFHLVARIKNIVSNPITDICFCENVVYSVCDHNKGMACYFDDSLIEGRERQNMSSRRLSHVASQPRKSRTMTPIIKSLPARFASKFKGFKARHITLHGIELKRIQISRDGRFIFTGKKSLKILESVGDKYGLLKVGDSVEQFIDLKLLDNGQFVVFCEQTSDLVKYDHNFEQIRRLQGQKPVNTNGSEIVTTLYANDNKVYIWMLGDNSIALVNPSTMVYNLIPNFFGSPSETVTPFTVICSVRDQRLLGLYMQKSHLALVFCRAGDKVIRKRQEDIVEEGTLLCLDTSVDDKLFFGGGGTQYNMKNGIAKIFAFTFDENMDLISELCLPSEKVRTMGVTCMKRMDDVDVLFVGTNRVLFVVEWTGSHFEILNRVEDVHSWLVNSIDYHGSTVFTVSKKDNHISKIVFREE